MNKGEYGYMNRYKKNHVIGVLIYAGVIVVLTLLAHFLNKSVISPACYVLAVVLALPAAKHFVAAFVVFSFHTIDEQSIEDLNEHTRPLRHGLTLYDVTLSSVDGIMYSPYMYLTEGKIYCLVLNTSAKVTIDTVYDYLNKILVNAGLQSEVIMVHNISEMNRILEDMEDNAETHMELLHKIKDEILLYSV